ncbi:hypothetical protein [Nonomuraea lactucae]|uniref:hypothetical protein n=1 Tax=Nonomuraea lactucae TaxID=2249762 RepID=UPI0023DD2BD8|nr:hypothetical protein [Nonomuraea lactucae]
MGLEHAFAERGVPLTVNTRSDVEIADLYERPFVLVRPVAMWRGAATICLSGPCSVRRHGAGRPALNPEWSA